MRRPRIALGVPAALLLGAVGMRVLLTHAPAALAADIVQPLAVATNWNAFGAMQLGLLLAAAGAAAAAYLKIVLGASKASFELRSWATVAGIALLALLAAWCAPLIFSSDVYAYAVYGELARLGGDPYAHRPLPPGNALFDAAIVQWGNPPPACVYGLPFVWIARAVVSVLHPFAVVVRLNGFRVLASAALLLTAPLAYYAYRFDPVRRLQAAATIGLNPVAIWCAAEGHNDALAVAVMLGGFALVARGRPAVGAALAALAGSVKLPGIAAGPAAVFNDKRAAIGGTIGVLAAIALSLPVLRSLNVGLSHAQYAPQASFAAIVKPIASVWLTGGNVTIAAWAAAAVVAAPCVLAGAAMLRRREAEGWTYLALGGWLLIPNPYPWYGIWLLPIAAAAPGTRGALVLIALSFTSLLRYLPDAVATPGPLTGALLGAGAALPFLWLLRRRAPRLL